jgi:protein CpxP
MKKACVILASALAMSGAFAQSATPASAPAAMAAPGGKMNRNIEDRIAYLHAQLKITPAEETQWTAFADVMRSNAETMGQLYRQRSEMTNESALDNMKQYEQITQAHADGMQKLVAAFEPLYSSMSPEQKKLADTTFRHTPHARGKKHPKPAQ